MPTKKTIKIRKKTRKTKVNNATEPVGVKQTTGAVHVYVNSGNTRTNATPKAPLYRKEKEAVMNSLLQQEASKIVPRIQLASSLPPAEAGYTMYRTLAENREKEFKDKVKKETEKLEGLYQRLNKQGSFRVSDKEGLMSNNVDTFNDVSTEEYKQAIDFGDFGVGETLKTPATRLQISLNDMKEYMKTHFAIVPDVPVKIENIVDPDKRERTILEWIDNMKGERNIQSRYEETRRIVEGGGEAKQEEGGGRAKPSGLGRLFSLSSSSKR